jgi:ATP-dependent Clp protease ATP-binding subunit ClpA
MTSNVEFWIQELGAKNKSEMENQVAEALRATFKPEFLTASTTSLSSMHLVALRSARSLIFS